MAPCVQKNSEYYIHIFDTAQSRYKWGVPSPRREYSEYQKHAKTFADPLYRHINWSWAPCLSYYDLYNPFKNYKVFSLHRSKDVSQVDSEVYQGELVPVTGYFSLLCHNTVLPRVKDEKQIKILRERRLSKHYTKVEIETSTKLAFILTLAILKVKNWLPGVEVEESERPKLETPKKEAVKRSCKKKL